METLYLIKDRSGVFHLVDARNNLIGRFNSREAAQKFCTENNYRMRDK